MASALIDPKTGKPFASKPKSLAAVDLLIVHHGDVGTERWTPQRFIEYRHESARALQASQKKQGKSGDLYAFSGYGYNAIIWPNGEIFFDVPLEETTWSAGGLNSRSFSACMAGNYMKDLPPEPALKRLEQTLVAWQRRRGWMAQIIGHRDGIRFSKNATRTSCPGDKMHAYLPTMIRRVEGYR
ncbi:N-acetylmuramoyl-L-alanine amidase [compost metagenome]